MDETTVRVISILLVLLTLVIIAVPSRRRNWLRPIGAYAAVPSLAGLAIEANRPVHISLGSAGIGDSSTLLALVSAELAYYLSERTAVGDVSPLITMSDPSALPVGQDALRRAYQARGMTGKYAATAVHWYPSGTHSLAFAAAVTGLMSSDRISSNIMGGRYGPELALILNASKRRGAASVAVSDQLEGQAVAFALADYPLIGEEVFVASSYLDDNPSATRKAVAIDVLRFLVAGAIVVGFAMKLAEGA